MNEKPQLTIDLSKSSGYAISGTKANAFSIIAEAVRCLKQAGQPEDAQALSDRFYAFAWLSAAESGKTLKRVGSIL